MPPKIFPVNSECLPSNFFFASTTHLRQFKIFPCCP
jgi:hypothetical protein